MPNKDNTFNPDEVTDIEASFMEAWLGGRKIDSLSTKLLYDIQTLMEHYRDIITPSENVRVEFPQDDSGARASVDNKIVFVFLEKFHSHLNH